MAAATRTFNKFKEKCGEFREKLDVFDVRLETVASEDTALQIKHQMLEGWDIITACFYELEDGYPEEPQIYVNEVLSERQNLYITLKQKFSNTRINAVNRLSKFRSQAEPIPARILPPPPAWLTDRKKNK